MKKLFIYFLVKILATGRTMLLLSHNTTKLLFIPGMEKMRWNIGKLKAYAQFDKAKNKVPAYRDFLRQNKFSKVCFKGLVPDLNTIPVTHKSNYVNKYLPHERCIGGRIPAKGIVIDESSGSTGMPCNWIRGNKERLSNKKMMEFGLAQLLGHRPKFIINAFAMGAWATGVNITMSLVDSAILKSPGPDIIKIENTLNFFGTNYNYIIMGYPPFLKALVDTAKVDWKSFNIVLIFGGEGMSEAMRCYIQSKGIKKIYSSFGASDLELNIASENDFTISLRKLLGYNKMLAGKLIKYPGTLPMIFQYNPLDFYIESTVEDELLFTLCRTGYVSPKIRYNIHDRGHVIHMWQLKEILKSCKINLNEIIEPGNDLPLLFHYGRADMSVAYFGCKIAPADIQEVIFKIPRLADNINSFTLSVYEDENMNKKLDLCFEQMDDRNIAFDIEEMNNLIFDELATLNQDFKESFRMVPLKDKPEVKFYKQGTGPFAGRNNKIKANYISEQKITRIPQVVT
ncbi:MAG: hypothetical protein ABIN97_19615 [Ginsengibacter sp.]